MFVHPVGRRLYGNWDDVAAATVAHLRAATSTYPDADDVAAVVEELLAASAEFAALWQRHDVRPRTTGRKSFVHPAVGQLTLEYEVLTVTGGDGQRLVVYHTDPGTPDHDAMLLLATADAMAT
jgi:hypothetical protein